MTIHVGGITTTPDASRVEMIVDGLPIWFESDDAPLAASPEAFGSALLIPGLATGRSLAIEHAVDPVWLDNTPRVLDFAYERWDFAPLDVAASGTTGAGVPAEGAGLCFSGGVDSFHSLFTEPVATIVQIQGFDMRLDDEDRLVDAEADARHVASELGITCIVVRTNLRSHPTFDAVSWELSHGGALAAVGHLLTGTIGSLGIASSSPRGTPGSWGSDYRLDSAWSSSILCVESFAIDASRLDKLTAIAHEPLVQSRLRVCWEHRTPDPNCSQCEKCIRTMIGLAAVGHLDDTPRFDGAPLVDRIRALSPLPSSVQREEYAEMLDHGLPTGVAAAVADLIERSRGVGLRW